MSQPGSALQWERAIMSQPGSALQWERGLMSQPGSALQWEREPVWFNERGIMSSLVQLYRGKGL